VSSDLASGTDLGTFLGLSPAPTGATLTSLNRYVDGAVALFQKLTHRTEAPFQDEESDRIEIHDGMGQTTILLDYPPDLVTEVTIGRDLDDPSETLDVSDPLQVIWREGDRRLRRTDGKNWQVSWATPGFVKVVYDAQADLPEDVRQAVLRLAGTLYQQQVSGTLTGLKSETLDNYSATYADLNTTVTTTGLADPAWIDVVDAHRRLIAL
jgi:hypothetical protein